MRRLRGVSDAQGDLDALAFSVEYDPDLVTIGAIQKMMSVMGHETTVEEER